MYILQILKIFFFYIRTTQREKAEREKAEQDQKNTVPSHCPSLSPSLHPVGASPAGSPCSSLLFAIPSSHDMVSPGSTPQSVSALRVRGCGHPRKALIPPSYDDKPENVSKEELLKWKSSVTTS